jgi:outer membrane protein assembly factor BamB
LSKPAAAGQASTAGGSSNPAAAAGWTLPGGNLQNTRDVASPITSSNVSTLGVAWCVPIESTGAASAAGIADGYATTPVVVNGDSQGNIYIGVANPGPIGQTGWPKGYPWGTSRPGPNLYTDSVVKLSPEGKMLWYYQLTPHDLYDWDLQDSPVLTTAHGQPVVIDGGKAGILIELSAQTGKLLWKRPVGVHSGHDNDGLLTEYATPTSPIPLPALFDLEPGVFGGIESQLATDGSTTFAAVNNLAVPISRKGVAESSSAFLAAITKAAGEMVAVNQDTGKIQWDDRLPSSPYGAAAVTNNVVFTTTYNGYLYAFNAATGAILLKTPLSAGTNAPVTIAGDYVIAGAGVTLSKSQHPLIIAYKLGAKGKLPDTVGS